LTNTHLRKPFGINYKGGITKDTECVLTPECELTRVLAGAKAFAKRKRNPRHKALSLRGTRSPTEKPTFECGVKGFANKRKPKKKMSESTPPWHEVISKEQVSTLRALDREDCTRFAIASTKVC
jgi:hypothetical protein